MRFPREINFRFHLPTGKLLPLKISISYLPFQRAVGPEFSFIPFIVVMLVVITTVAVFLPETKNRSIDDIAAGLSAGNLFGGLSQSGLLRRVPCPAQETAQPDFCCLLFVRGEKPSDRQQPLSLSHCPILIR